MIFLKHLAFRMGAALVFVGCASQLHAIVVDGTRDAEYGAPLAVQTINTGYGNNTSAGGLSSGGSELDAAYARMTNGYLYLFIAGNFQGNGNRVNIFLADGRAGQNTFSAPSGSIANMNGSKFSPGFEATLVLDLNVSVSGTTNVNATEFQLFGTPVGGSQGAFTLGGGIGSGTPNSQGWATPITIALNNLNTAGVVGSSSGSAADQTAAAAVTTGYEFAIPLALLGNPTGEVKVMADINGVSNNGPLSNQFLPGLPVGTTNFALGGPFTGSTTAKFDFSSRSNQFFIVPAPVPVPQVSLTAPANNATFLPGADITLTATASEAGGSITNVAFLADGLPLGNDATAPYSFTWTNVPLGVYALTAVATDAGGISVTSSVANVFVGVTMAADDAAAYESWANGSNFGLGFEPWILTHNNNNGPTFAGFYISHSASVKIATGGNTWGMYANGTGAPYAIAYRSFNSLPVGRVFKVRFQNTGIATDGRMGFCLRSDTATNFTSATLITNAATRFAFYFVGGQSHYSIWNGTGVVNTGVPWTTNGLSLEFYLASADTYELAVKTGDGSATIATFPVAPLAGGAGTSVGTFAGFNLATGSSQNAYFNNLEITSPTPTVSLTAPSATTSFAPGDDITISASASEFGGGITNVAFYADGVFLGDDAAAPYSFTWTNVPYGFYALTAVATDAAGLMATSAVVNITVSSIVAYDDAAPYNNWANGANFGLGFQPWILANNNNGGPTYAGFIIGSSGGINSGGKTWGMYANGSGSPYAIAYRRFNNALPVGRVFAVKFQNTAIASGGTMGWCLRSETNANLTGNAIITDPGTRFAFYFSGGQGNYSIRNGNGVVDSGIPYTIGGLLLEFFLATADTYELVVRAADGSATLARFPIAPLAGGSGAALQAFAGFNLSTASLQDAYFNRLRIAPPEPVVTLTAPVNNQNFAHDATVTLTADAFESGGVITNVAFYAGADFLGNATVAPYELAWNPAVGNHALTAVATDANGHSSTSSVVNVTIGPIVRITSPAHQARFALGAAIPITAEASEAGGSIANVAFYAGSTLLGNAASAPYTFIWTNAAFGTHALTAVATNPVGISVTSAAVSIKVISVPAVPPVAHVIHISVDGLRSDAITALGSGSLPNFYRLRTEGAFTDNARTDYDYTETLPNHTAQFTGRGVLGATGHNWTENTDPPPGVTLGSNKGSYVAGVFDVAHDNGLRTGLFTSKSKFSLYAASWDASNGAFDVIPPDYGRNKIDVYSYLNDTSDLVNALIANMGVQPFQYAFLHLRDPDSAGHGYGWVLSPTNSEYCNSVRRVDQLLGRIFTFIDTNATYAGRTAIVLTADHGGGEELSHGNAAAAVNYTIPFYVWGPGVMTGADLYRLNPNTRADPGVNRPTYAAPLQPVRNGEAANVSLRLLGLLAVPGSTINPAQDLALAIPPPPDFQLAASGNQFKARFTMQTNVLYDIQASSDLGAGVWTTILTNIPGLDGLNTEILLEQQTTNPMRFFRLKMHF